MTNKLLTTIVISLLLLNTVPAKAKNIHQNHLENTEVIVRDSLISKGIKAYKVGNYQRAIQLLQNSVSFRKVTATPLEIQGLNYLALAYQKVGKQSLAAEVTVRTKSLLKLSPAELY